MSERAEKSVALPPGQRWVQRLVVQHVGEPPPFDGTSWNLSLSGALERPRVFTLQELRELSTIELRSDFHSATGWSVRGVRWGGARLVDLLQRAIPQARAVCVRCYDGVRYDATLSLAAASEPDVLVATRLDGADLPVPHGGPVRLVAPGRYGWKSVKWLRGIELHAEERQGFWERRGFHAQADPWKDQRFA